MATNYLQDGDALTLTAPSGGVVAGTPVQIGQILVVPTASVAATLPFTGLTRGVFSVPKVGSQAWTEGAIVYWSQSSGYFTTSASGNLLAGVAVEAVGSGAGATTGKVRLNGVGRVQES